MLTRRAAVEGVGTALLLAAVVGSGIMGERLAEGNRAVALLANSIATGAALLALITAFGPRSGAHFNPIVTLALDAPGRDKVAYIAAQVVGSIAGVIAANVMFGGPALQVSATARHGIGQLLGESVATFGLLAIILTRPANTALAVAGYITAAYWFTSSTSFANPAVTVGRACTDSFAGIRPADVPAFIAAQAIGGVLAVGFFRWLERSPREDGSLRVRP